MEALLLGLIFKCILVDKLIKPLLYTDLFQDHFAPSSYFKLPNFENDTLLIPKETSWFGYYPDGAFKPILPPQQTQLYIEDWIGLKTLDEAGRVKYITVPGYHLDISQSDIEEYVLPYL
uniref:Uncharacterized protein n=1 Tax=Quercus lobata TaxID=97700 RepID=A0A7N2N2L4_QUELO